MREAESPPDSNGLPFFELFSLAIPNYEIGDDALKNQLDFYLPFRLPTSFLARFSAFCTPEDNLACSDKAAGKPGKRRLEGAFESRC